MAKKGVKKKPVKKNSKKKFFDDKKLLVATIGVFVLLALALNFVSVGEGITGYATNTQQVKGNLDFSGTIQNSGTVSSAQSFISSMFADWQGGQLDINITKYLFWIIVFLLIFSSFKFAGIPKNSYIQGLLALIISFLAVAYIAPNEIFVLLTGYTALGMTLIVIMPFAVMVFGSAMLLSYNPKMGGQISVAKILFEMMLWVFFVLFLIYKLIIGYANVDRANWMLIVMWVVLGLSLTVLIWNKQFREWVKKLGIEVLESRGEIKKVATEMNRTMQSTIVPTNEEVMRYGN